jgi:hypothetical protein
VAGPAHHRLPAPADLPKQGSGFDLADSFRRSLRSRNWSEHTILSRDVERTVERGLERGLGIEL